MGGLGNQMFQYATAKAIASSTKTSFMLDISFYKLQTLRNYRLSQFCIDETIATQADVCRLKGCGLGYIGKTLDRFGLKFHRPKSYRMEKSRTTFDQSVFDAPNIYLDGYWQNEKYFVGIRSIILADFAPRAPISTYVLRHLDLIRNSNSVSVHVRRGDYLNHPQIGILPLSYYREAISYMEKQISNPVFFIFSDDIEWCKENLALPHSHVYVDDTSSEIEDLELMKSCQHNIIANSSFSWWGAWLNQNESKIIISPQRWVANNRQSHKWVPDEWLQF